MTLAGEVTIHDKHKTQPGYVLYSPYAGDGFVLINREGEIVHRWATGRHTKIAELLPNGRILYARMRDGVFEADWNNNVLWSYRCRQHHDFCRKENGNTLIVCNEFVFIDRIWRGAMDKNDVFVEVDREGNVVWEYHLDQGIDDMLALLPKFKLNHAEDWAHNNTVESLPETELGKKDERFRAGNVLFSGRSIHTIGIIDYDTKRIVWAFGEGELDGQHMPTMLPNGDIMVFDNGTSRGYSRVIEIGPVSREIVWEFRVPDYAFAKALSGAELLPNGNILVCCGNPGSELVKNDPGSTTTGRRGVIMEVTRDKEIVWEFHNEIDGLRKAYLNAVYRAAFCPAERVEPHLRVNLMV